LDKVNINDKNIFDGLGEIALYAYKNALEGKTNYFEMHTVDDIIQEFEKRTGCAANEFFIAFATLAHKYSLEATAKGRAEREALSA